MELCQGWINNISSSLIHMENVKMLRNNRLERQRRKACTVLNRILAKSHLKYSVCVIFSDTFIQIWETNGRKDIACIYFVCCKLVKVYLWLLCTYYRIILNYKSAVQFTRNVTNKHTQLARKNRILQHVCSGALVFLVTK